MSDELVDFFVSGNFVNVDMGIVLELFVVVDDGWIVVFEEWLVVCEFDVEYIVFGFIDVYMYVELLMVMFL